MNYMTVTHFKKKLAGLIVAIVSCLTLTAEPYVDVHQGRLIGPAEIELNGTSWTMWNAAFEIEIMWDKDVPLHLDLYLSEDRVNVGGPLVNFVLRDPKGNEVPVWVPVSSYLPSQGVIRVYKGQKLKIPVVGNGVAQVELGVKYSVSTRFIGLTKNGAVEIQGSTEVIFKSGPLFGEGKNSKKPAADGQKM